MAHTLLEIQEKRGWSSNLETQEVMFKRDEDWRLSRAGLKAYLPPLPAPAGSAALLWEPVLLRSSQKAAGWFVTDDMPREGQQLLQGHPDQSYPTGRKDEGAVGVQRAGSAAAAESAGPALDPRPLWGRFLPLQKGT